MKVGVASSYCVDLCGRNLIVVARAVDVLPVIARELR
jgi:hypothetical protein